MRRFGDDVCGSEELLRRIKVRKEESENRLIAAEIAFFFLVGMTLSALCVVGAIM